MGVQEDEVGFGRGDCLESLLAADGPFDVITILFQELQQRGGAGGVMVDDKDEPTVGQN